jgi:anti-sigma factor RsiW
LSCDETRELLHAYVDGELDLAHALGVERHLDDCPACVRARDELLALRTLVQNAAPRFRASESLHQRVQEALSGPRPTVRPHFSWRRYLFPLAVAASLALVFGMGWLTAWARYRPAAADLLAQQVVANHVRSLMAEHLLDVASSNKHTVKPWFLGRVSFSPDVPDLSEKGFKLVGGRLDYLEERPSAALVYKRRDHVINVFLASAGREPDAKTKDLNVRGFHLLYWVRSGVAFWAVSDLNEEELREFVRLFQEQAVS